MILDEFGRRMIRTSATPLDKLLSADQNIFEGLVNIQVFDDAVAAKATCAHCLGIMEGVLHFPGGYLAGPDRDDREVDVRRQVIARIKRDHHCIPRIDGPKLPVKDFNRRFE